MLDSVPKDVFVFLINLCFGLLLSMPLASIQYTCLGISWWNITYNTTLSDLMLWRSLIELKTSWKLAEVIRLFANPKFKKIKNLCDCTFGVFRKTSKIVWIESCVFALILFGVTFVYLLVYCQNLNLPPCNITWY